MLGQKKDKVIRPIYYASKTLNEAQKDYITIEKELFTVVFTIVKYRSYIVGSIDLVNTDSFSIKYLTAKKDTKLWLIRWIVLLKEIDLKIIDRKGTENQVVDHLSCLSNEPLQCQKKDIKDCFPDEQLFCVEEREP